MEALDTLADLLPPLQVGQKEAIAEPIVAEALPPVEAETEQIPSDVVTEVVEANPEVDKVEAPSYDPSNELAVLLGEKKSIQSESKFKDLTEVLGKEVKDELELAQEVKSLKAKYEEKISVLESSRINDVETIKSLAKLESYNPDNISDDAYIRSQFPEGEVGEAAFQDFKESSNPAVFQYEAKKLRDQEHFLKNAKIEKIRNAEFSKKQAIDTQLKSTLSTMTKAFNSEITQSEKDSVYNSLKRGIAGKYINADGSIDIDRAVMSEVALIKFPQILKSHLETLEKEKKESFVQGKKEIIKTQSNVQMNRKEQPAFENPVAQDGKKVLVDALDSLFKNTHGI